MTFGWRQYKWLEEMTHVLAEAAKSIKGAVDRQEQI